MSNDSFYRGMSKDPVTFSVVCDECGREWESRIEWVDNDPCMPERYS